MKFNELVELVESAGDEGIPGEIFEFTADIRLALVATDELTIEVREGSRSEESLLENNPDLLHCFLDTKLARGYLAWVAPAPGFFQVGLATNADAKPDLKAFLNHTESIFGFSAETVKERRSGLIPCGGPVEPFAAPNVLLVGDAAGHVSPLTGGGIRLAFRYGRRAGQLIADHLLRHGPAPKKTLAAELPSFTKKTLLRKVMDIGPPNWFYDLMIGTPAMNWFARQVYFHKRAESGDSLEAFEQRLKNKNS